ncbi:MAG: hypothetical protein HYW45_01980 [Candidatus Daviesbacteria bacterium]|nr:MAG: hypothetical protein HYW45_01980 [Candidatus Daviesbacteria bacterium]
MKFAVAKATGLNSDQQAALVNCAEQNGQLFVGLVRLAGDDAFTRGRQLLSELSDLFWEEEGSIGEKLTKVFAEAKLKLTGVSSAEILLAALSGKVLYLISQGEGAAYLKREGKLSVLTGDGEGQLVSGFLQPGDRVLFATTSLLKFLGDNLTKSLELSLPDWEEEIGSRINSAEFEEHGLAGLVLSVEEEEVPAEMSPTSPIANFDQTPSPPGSGWRFNPGPVFKNIIPESSRGKLILAAFLLLVILAGIGWQYKKTKDGESNRLFAGFLQAAQADFESASSLQSLNPPEAKNKLNFAKDNLAKALAVKPKDAAALELQNKINLSADSILQQFKGVNFDSFLDLNLVKKDFRPTQMSLSVGKLLLLDKDSNTLVTIDLGKKQQQIQAGGGSLGQSQKASLNGSNAFVYAKDKGVVKVDTTNQKTSTVAKMDDEWGEIVDLAGFSGNVYLLDAGKGQVWKYVPTTAGFSNKQTYFTKDTKADLAGAQKMQIESSVYVLKSGGDILRFTRGASDFFSVGGLDQPIKSISSIFTSSEVENFYILDSGNSRLVVTTKTGAYKSQYQGDKFGTAADLAVDEKGKKAYLLDSGKIYTMDLK